jgi:hypothetical protein
VGKGDLIDKRMKVDVDAYVEEIGVVAERVEVRDLCALEIALRKPCIDHWKLICVEQCKFNLWVLNY